MESNNRLLEEMDAQEAKNWAVFSHLGTFAGSIVPMGNVILPLLIYLLKKDESEYVEYHAKEALNFQITLSIALVVSAILIIVLVGIFMLIGLVLFAVAISIIAAVKASQGTYYEYPLIIRFVK